MKIGTKSILFGVHQFFWHPWTVYRAWRHLYGRPTWIELLAILLHDIGYVSCSDMDGEEGKRHPYAGALLTARIVVWLRYGYWLEAGVPHDGTYGSLTYWFTACHSRHAARTYGRQPSKLCWADKAAVLFDPPWFYLLRGRLSGEIQEFKQHAIDSGHIRPGATDRDWLQFYREHTRNNPEIAKLL